MNRAAQTEALLAAAKEEEDRILKLTDEEVMVEHLALYDGDERLARKSIDMMRAGLQRLLAGRWKQ